MCKCKGCTKREVGCHANCADYADYKAKLEEQKKKNAYCRASWDAKVVSQKTGAFVTIMMKGKATKIARY